MRLSFVIPAYNEENYLPGCLESVLADIARSPQPAEVEVIVVDNASTDRTGEVAASFPGVCVVREPVKGLTRARQLGLEAAAGEIVACVDADVRIPPGWIARVLAAFADDPGLVCISGPCGYYDGSRAELALAWLYWTLLATPTYWVTRYMVLGGNFAARRGALVAIGGFDTSIAFYGEDTNIARRLHGAGRVRFTARLRILTSARRLHGEGICATVWRYMLNFLSEVLIRRPVTRSYRDVR